eukprot:XP_001697542.1 predicted protein [Chlamydomonas reinhardtii]
MLNNAPLPPLVAAASAPAMTQRQPALAGLDPFHKQKMALWGNKADLSLLVNAAGLDAAALGLGSSATSSTSETSGISGAAAAQQQQHGHGQGQGRGQGPELVPASHVIVDHICVDVVSAAAWEPVRRLAARWRAHLAAGRWSWAAHPFWTTPVPYCWMPYVAPDLYGQLAASDLVVLKGDLNYRKLTHDCSRACCLAVGGSLTERAHTDSPANSSRDSAHRDLNGQGPQVVVFGDSLSDVGNVYNFTDGFMPSRGRYWAGRYADGPGWLDQLATTAAAAGSTATATDQRQQQKEGPGGAAEPQGPRQGRRQSVESAVLDFAFGGSTACPSQARVSAMVPSLAAQLAQRRIRRVIHVWTGHNDFLGGAADWSDPLVGPALAANVSACVGAALDRIVAAAEQEAAAAPHAAVNAPEPKPLPGNDVAAVSAASGRPAPAPPPPAGVLVVPLLFDANAAISCAALQPEAVGLSNGNTSCLQFPPLPHTQQGLSAHTGNSSSKGGGGMPLATGAFLQVAAADAATPCPDPSAYLWYDGMHLTAAADARLIVEPLQRAGLGLGLLLLPAV